MVSCGGSLLKFPIHTHTKLMDHPMIIRVQFGFYSFYASFFSFSQLIPCSNFALWWQPPWIFNIQKKPRHFGKGTFHPSLLPEGADKNISNCNVVSIGSYCSRVGISLLFDEFRAVWLVDSVHTDIISCWLSASLFFGRFKRNSYKSYIWTISWSKHQFLSSFFFFSYAP